MNATKLESEIDRRERLFKYSCYSVATIGFAIALAFYLWADVSGWVLFSALTFVGGLTFTAMHDNSPTLSAMIATPTGGVVAVAASISTPLIPNLELPVGLMTFFLFGIVTNFLLWNQWDKIYDLRAKYLGPEFRGAQQHHDY